MLFRKSKATSMTNFKSLDSRSHSRLKKFIMSSRNRFIAMLRFPYVCSCHEVCFLRILKLVSTRALNNVKPESWNNLYVWKMIADEVPFRFLLKVFCSLARSLAFSCERWIHQTFILCVQWRARKVFVLEREKQSKQTLIWNGTYMANVFTYFSLLRRHRQTLFIIKV